jgi:hypothetical protein
MITSQKPAQTTGGKDSAERVRMQHLAVPVLGVHGPVCGVVCIAVVGGPTVGVCPSSPPGDSSAGTLVMPFRDDGVEKSNAIKEGGWGLSMCPSLSSTLRIVPVHCQPFSDAEICVVRRRLLPVFAWDIRGVPPSVEVPTAALQRAESVQSAHLLLCALGRGAAPVAGGLPVCLSGALTASLEAACESWSHAETCTAARPRPLIPPRCWSINSTSLLPASAMPGGNPNRCCTRVAHVRGVLTAASLLCTGGGLPPPAAHAARACAAGVPPRGEPTDTTRRRAVGRPWPRLRRHCRHRPGLPTHGGCGAAPGPRAPQVQRTARRACGGAGTGAGAGAARHGSRLDRRHRQPAQRNLLLGYGPLLLGGILCVATK